MDATGNYNSTLRNFTSVIFIGIFLRVYFLLIVMSYIFISMLHKAKY